jgi:hypothetical protein
MLCRWRGRNSPRLGSSCGPILAWEPLADRETKWNAFLSDPEWLHVRDESEKDGAIVGHISNQILSPTSFSTLA